MAQEPAQSVDVDSAVIHPDALQHIGGSGRALADEEGLVVQIENVAHFPEVPPDCRTCMARMKCRVHQHDSARCYWCERFTYSVRPKLRRRLCPCRACTR